MSILPTTARCGETCTGEHVIGLGKIDHLEQEHGDLLPHLARLKASFDPNGILNPGKLLRTSD
jgi:D-lactate dehydrogenase (cytochrome)